MKTHYDLLAIDRAAPADEVKRAFRREIARYHPDKVQHLGAEFQEIAATRAAELTEAYRVLMDADLRRSYDESLGVSQPEASPPKPPSKTAQTEPPPPPRVTPAEPAKEGPRDRRYEQERATTIEFLRRALLAKFADTVSALGGAPTSQPPFDAAYRFKGRRGLFAQADPSVRLLLRVVPLVDRDAIEEAWVPAARVSGEEDIVCLLLLGNGLAPATELSAAISEQRRRTRKVGAVVIPVDMRDWEALFPPDTPSVVRTLLERLRSGR